MIKQSQNLGREPVRTQMREVCTESAHIPNQVSGTKGKEMR